METAAWRSGKTHRDENFPVARLVRARHREPILAFYDFVRTADDIADHAQLAPDDKLRGLDALEATLAGRDEAQPTAVRLRRVLEERGLRDGHARDLLCAFRQDVTQKRYATWDELLDYCALSAMPVGRFVLDVHGEDQKTWTASDPLCAALQIINHLQDCGEDYRQLDRVYLPLDALARAGADVNELGAPKASPCLRACLAELARRTRGLVDQGATLPALVSDARLGVECSVIHALAAKLIYVLERRDPLSERVHFGKFATLSVALAGAASGAFARFTRSPAITALGKGRA
jgi:squalene synthase HpnC